MRLCPFTEADWPTIEPWFPPKGTGSFMDVDWLEAAAKAAGYKPEAHSLFVGCRDGEPVSVCSVSLHRDPELRAVVSLLVPRERRQTGAARATVEALRDSFPEVAEFVAYVDPANAPSLAMLASFGFARVQSDANRELFVWRRDGSPPAAGWKPPPFVPWWRR